MALLLLVPSPARALNVEASHFTLDNGLQVVVIADRRAPVVTNMVWYPVGSADEPAGKAGTAQFLEHLLFKGTKTLSPGEFSNIVYRQGGEGMHSPAATVRPTTSRSAGAGSLWSWRSELSPNVGDGRGQAAA